MRVILVLLRIILGVRIGDILGGRVGIMMNYTGTLTHWEITGVRMRVRMRVSYTGRYTGI